MIIQYSNAVTVRKGEEGENCKEGSESSPEHTWLVLRSNSVNILGDLYACNVSMVHATLRG